MDLCKLLALSPLDGRYKDKLSDLSTFFSEYAFIKYRLKVEIRWFQHILNQNLIGSKIKLTKNLRQYLESIENKFTPLEAIKVKAIENKTKHDIKAIEYYLKKKIALNSKLKPYLEYIHLGCTSEDINNVAYALIVRDFQKTIYSTTLLSLIKKLRHLAVSNANLPILARTHGQPASPTTFGKEFANFVSRIEKQYKKLEQFSFFAKFNGAVGNYNALTFAFPDIFWERVSENFIKSLGLSFDRYTTQVESYDYLSELFHLLVRINTILIDLCQDIWLYSSFKYIKIKSSISEIGSSTMPHKTNPIDFENAEGNFYFANSILNFLSLRIPISRLQRDLSNSTLMRNIGVGFSHTILGLRSLLQGISKIEIDPVQIENDLKNRLDILTEAVQTELRKFKIKKPYEKLKRLSALGEKFDQKKLFTFIDSLNLPKESINKLKQLTPGTYTGLASKLAKKI